MNEPFKFRYVNEIVGGFVLVVVVILIAGIFLAGRAQGWFETPYMVHTTFPAEGAFGLQEGAEVRIVGTLAGTVEEIVPNDAGQLDGHMKIRRRFQTYIRKDSVAAVKKKLGVGGDAYVEISRGTGDPLPPDRSYVPFKKEKELLETVEEVVDEFKAVTVPAVEQLRVTLKEYGDLAAGLNAPTGHVQGILRRAEQIVVNLEEGEGAVGRLLSDPEVAEDIEAAIEKVNELLARVADETLPAVTEPVPDLLRQAESVLAETERLIEGFQRHWLVRKYIEADEAPPAGISPAVLTDLGATREAK